MLASEPRRFAIGAAVLAACALAVVVLVARPAQQPSHSSVSMSDRMRAIALAEQWRAAARSVQCTRTPLREPTTGDATAHPTTGEVAALPITGDATGLLATLIPSSRDHSPCTRAMRPIDGELRPFCNGGPCPRPPLVSLAPHPDVEQACAEVYDVIDRVATATAACSPLDARTADDMTLPVWISRAVRIRVARMVQRGELAPAARLITNAMRVADDLGRNGTLIGTMLGVAFMRDLGDTLDEILVDPRLRPEEARAIAKDLEVLRTTAPAFPPMLLQENLYVLRLLEQRGAGAFDDFVPEMLKRDRIMRVVETTCATLSLRSCVPVIAAAELPGPLLWFTYAKKLADRDDMLARLLARAASRFPP